MITTSLALVLTPQDSSKVMSVQRNVTTTKKKRQVQFKWATVLISGIKSKRQLLKMCSHILLLARLKIYIKVRN